MRSSDTARSVERLIKRVGHLSVSCDAAIDRKWCLASPRLLTILVDVGIAGIRSPFSSQCRLVEATVEVVQSKADIRLCMNCLHWILLRRATIVLGEVCSIFSAMPHAPTAFLCPNAISGCSRFSMFSFHPCRNQFTLKASLRPQPHSLRTC